EHRRPTDERVAAPSLRQQEVADGGAGVEGPQREPELLTTQGVALAGVGKQHVSSGSRPQGDAPGVALTRCLLAPDITDKRRREGPTRRDDYEIRRRRPLPVPELRRPEAELEGGDFGRGVARQPELHGRELVLVHRPEDHLRRGAQSLGERARPDEAYLSPLGVPPPRQLV